MGAFLVNEPVGKFKIAGRLVYLEEDNLPRLRL
jgi:hypothetical protein